MMGVRLMKKCLLTILVTIACSAFIATTGIAAPLTGYVPGKTALDINWLPNLQMTDSYVSSGNSGTDKGKGKNGIFDWGVTTGLGNKWAIQYRQFNPETKEHLSSGMLQQFGMKAQEFNVLYEIDKNMVVFAGCHQAKYTFSSSPNPNMTTTNKNVLQTGLIGMVEIAPKTQLYGIAGIGSGLTNFEAGVAFEVDKSLDLNLFYRYKKVAKMNNTSWGQAFADDITAKGFGLGFTWNF